MNDIMTLNSPEDWKLHRLGQLFRERKAKGSDKDFAPLSVTMRGIVPQLETAAKSDDGDNRKVVRVGDYAINSRSDRKGSGGISDHEGSVSLISIVLEPRNIDSRFSHHLLRSTAFQEEFYRWGHGIVADLWTTRYGDMKNIRLRVPDIPTQRVIADFLDRETTRIDSLIEKKQRLMGLLGEKAKTKKLHLVTGQQKGAQKETKILWASSIPDHWEERAVWMLFELGRGRVMSHEYIAENEGEYPIYSSQTANDGVMGCINTYDFEGEYLTWTTDGAKAGTVFRRRGKFNCTNVCGTLRPVTHSIDLNYAQVALDTATDFFVRHDINPKLMNGVMSKIRIPYPPLEEQQEIGLEIDRIEQSFKPIWGKNQTSIDRLKEYRSALITAAVTGQIDVTSYARSGTTDRQLDAIHSEIQA